MVKKENQDPAVDLEVVKFELQKVIFPGCVTAEAAIFALSVYLRDAAARHGSGETFNYITRVALEQFAIFIWERWHARM